MLPIILDFYRFYFTVFALFEEEVLRSDMNHIQAKMKFFNIIIFGKFFEQIYLGFNHEKMTSFNTT